MSRRSQRLLLLAVTAVAISLWWGCTQPEDVVVPQANTRIDLSVERLPNNPSGMLYELWAVKDSTDTASFKSIARFGYDQIHKVFLDTNNEVEREDGGVFYMDENIYGFQLIILTVERVNGEQDVTPGPIMLLDGLTYPDDNPIRMRFRDSDSLWKAMVVFNMETPSDSDRTTNDGCGLWFCRYEQRQDSVRDTFAIDSCADTSVSGYPDCDSLHPDWRIDIGILMEPDTTSPTGDTMHTQDTTTYYIKSIDSFWVIDTLRIFGVFDTLSQKAVRYSATWDSSVDTPYLINTYTMFDNAEQFFRVGNAELEDTLDPSIYPYLDTVFPFDSFSSSYDSLLIDYSDHGWKYEGWIVSNVSEIVGCSELQQVTLPGWQVTNAEDIEYYLPGVWDGRMISTGTFDRPDRPDDRNPYGEYGPNSPRVPPFPGEDFLHTGCGDNIDFVDGVSRGCVIISLRPDNMADTMTNFPLIVLARELPPSDDYQDPLDGGFNTTFQDFDMKNWTQTIEGDLYGFPQINVTITTF